MSPITRDVLDAAIARIDKLVARAALATGSPEEATSDAQAWQTCRRELRLRRAQSERAVPAAANAAQHFVQARNELEQGLEKLAHVASPPPEDDSSK